MLESKAERLRDYLHNSAKNTTRCPAGSAIPDRQNGRPQAPDTGMLIRVVEAPHQRRHQIKPARVHGYSTIERIASRKASENDR